MGKRERYFRIIISSLVNSNLSIRDLIELSELFQFDRNFAQDLGNSLSVIAKELRQETIKENIGNSDDEDWITSKAINSIKNRNLLKADVEKRITLVLRDDGKFVQENKNLSLKRLIKRFSELQGPLITGILINLIESNESTNNDAYLKGILKRNT